MTAVAGVIASSSVLTGSTTPPSIAGLQTWLDATVAGSITFTGAPKVSGWTDLSANGWAFANAYSPEFPTLTTGGLKAGLDSIDFNASALNGPSSSGANQKPFTCFAALKHTGVAADRAILATNNSGGMNWQINASHRQVFNKHFISTVGTSTGTVPANIAVVLCVTYSAAGELIFYVNNVGETPIQNNQTLDSNPPQARVGVGSGQNFTGTIGEIIKYDTVLSSTNRTSIYNYLAAKWL